MTKQKNGASELEFTGISISQDDVFGNDAAKGDEAKGGDEKDKGKEDLPVLSQEEIFKVPTEDKTEKKEDGDSEKTSPNTPDPKTSADETVEEIPSLVFAKYLKDQGVFVDFNEDEFKQIYEQSGNNFAEPIKVVIQEHLQRQTEAVKSQLSEQAKGFAEYVDLLNKGLDPNEALTITYQKNKLSEISEAQLAESQDLRRDVLFNIYRNTTSLSDKEIYELIEDKIALKKDVDEAKSALPKLINMYNEKEKQAIAQEQQRRDDAAKQQDEYLKVAKQKSLAMEEFLGNKFHQKTREEIYKMAFAPSVKYQNGVMVSEIEDEYNRDPQGFMLKVAAMKKLGVWDNKLDRVEQVVKNKVVSNVSDVLKGEAEKMRNSASMSVNKDTGGKKSKDSVDEDWEYTFKKR